MNQSIPGAKHATSMLVRLLLLCIMIYYDNANEPLWTARTNVSTFVDRIQSHIVPLPLLMLHFDCCRRRIVWLAVLLPRLP